MWIEYKIEFETEMDNAQPCFEKITEILKNELLILNATKILPTITWEKDAVDK